MWSQGIGEWQERKGRRLWRSGSLGPSTNPQSTVPGDTIASRRRDDGEAITATDLAEERHGFLPKGFRGEADAESTQGYLSSRRQHLYEADNSNGIKQMDGGQRGNVNTASKWIRVTGVSPAFLFDVREFLDVTYGRTVDHYVPLAHTRGLSVGSPHGKGTQGGSSVENVAAARLLQPCEDINWFFVRFERANEAMRAVYDGKAFMDVLSRTDGNNGLLAHQRNDARVAFPKNSPPPVFTTPQPPTGKGWGIGDAAGMAPFFSGEGIPTNNLPTPDPRRQEQRGSLFATVVILEEGFGMTWCDDVKFMQERERLYCDVACGNSTSMPAEGASPPTYHLWRTPSLAEDQGRQLEKQKSDNGGGASLVGTQPQPQQEHHLRQQDQINPYDRETIGVLPSAREGDEGAALGTHEIPHHRHQQQQKQKQEQTQQSSPPFLPPPPAASAQDQSNSPASFTSPVRRSATLQHAKTPLLTTAAAEEVGGESVRSWNQPGDGKEGRKERSESQGLCTLLEEFCNDSREEGQGEVANAMERHATRAQGSSSGRMVSSSPSLTLPSTAAMNPARAAPAAVSAPSTASLRDELLRKRPDGRRLQYDGDHSGEEMDGSSDVGAAHRRNKDALSGHSHTADVDHSILDGSGRNSRQPQSQQCQLQPGAKSLATNTAAASAQAVSSQATAAIGSSPRQFPSEASSSVLLFDPSAFVPVSMPLRGNLSVLDVLMPLGGRPALRRCGLTTTEVVRSPGQSNLDTLSGNTGDARSKGYSHSQQQQQQRSRQQQQILLANKNVERFARVQRLEVEEEAYRSSLLALTEAIPLVGPMKRMLRYLIQRYVWNQIALPMDPGWLEHTWSRQRYILPTQHSAGGGRGSSVTARYTSAAQSDSSSSIFSSIGSVLLRALSVLSGDAALYVPSSSDSSSSTSTRGKTAFHVNQRDCDDSALLLSVLRCGAGAAAAGPLTDHRHNQRQQQLALLSRRHFCSQNKNIAPPSTARYALVSKGCSSDGGGRFDRPENAATVMTQRGRQGRYTGANSAGRGEGFSCSNKNSNSNGGSGATLSGVAAMAIVNECGSDDVLASWRPLSRLLHSATVKTVMSLCVVYACYLLCMGLIGHVFSAGNVGMTSDNGGGGAGNTASDIWGGGGFAADGMGSGTPFA